MTPDAMRKLKGRIVRAYAGLARQAYCSIRFKIINPALLERLFSVVQGRGRVLEIGCGFGLFGCYFVGRDPGMSYLGIDFDAARIGAAREAVKRLGFANARFEVGDAREQLKTDDQYDVILMMDLLHHIPDDAKQRLLEFARARLAPAGRIVIKDIDRRPLWKLFVTWLLDLLVTRSFGMWYWSADRFRSETPAGWSIEVTPLDSGAPYPHILYVIERTQPT